MQEGYMQQNFRMRPQSAKVPNQIKNPQELKFNQNKPPKPIQNNLIQEYSNEGENSDPIYKVIPQRSTSQKGGYKSLLTSPIELELSRPDDVNQYFLKVYKRKKNSNYQQHESKHLSMPEHLQTEKLLEEIRQLKQKLNDTKDDNIKLKTKNMMLEKEKIKYERAIQDIQIHGMANNRLFQKLGNDIRQVNYVFQMKQQIKDMKCELDQKEEDINKIRKIIRYTKIQEVEMEKKAFADETIRLKNIIQQLVDQQSQYQQQNSSQQLLQLQYQMEEQNNILEQYQQDNIEMSQAIKELEYQNKQLQDFIGQKSPESKKLEMQLTSLKQELNLKNKEIQSLKNQIKMLEKKSSNASNKFNERPQSGVQKRQNTQQSQQEQQQLKQELSQMKKDMEELTEAYQLKVQENEELKQELSGVLQYLQENGLIQEKSQLSNHSQYRENEVEIAQYEEEQEQLKFRKGMNESWDADKRRQSESYEQEEPQQKVNPFEKEIQEMKLRKQREAEEKKKQEEKQKQGGKKQEEEKKKQQEEEERKRKQEEDRRKELEKRAEAEIKKELERQLEEEEDEIDYNQDFDREEEVEVFEEEDYNKKIEEEKQEYKQEQKQSDDYEQEFDEMEQEQEQEQELQKSVENEVLIKQQQGNEFDYNEFEISESKGVGQYNKLRKSQKKVSKEMDEDEEMDMLKGSSKILKQSLMSYDGGEINENEISDGDYNY